eukprot:scpid55234/ scgid0410/ Major facilitator superfamily domain-containing protein 1
MSIQSPNEDKMETKRLLNGTHEDNLCGCGSSAVCHPARAPHRYIMLLFMCFLSFGSYFCYDNPAALQSTIQQVMKVDTEQFELLYSLYSWPNVVLSAFGGFLIDRVFGIRWGTIIFTAIILIGQIIFAMGAQVNSFLIMQIGRFVFGLGGENLAVAQNTYAVSWFKGRELNMAFGLQLSFSRMGSTVNMLSIEKTYNAVHFDKDYQRLAFTFFTGVMYCVFSMVCAFVLLYFDKRRSRWLNLEAAETGEVVHLRDIKDFPLSLWLIFIICVTYYVAIFPFISLGTVFFEDKFNLPSDSAHFVNSLVYLISLGASFLFGILVDKTGLNLLWVFIAILGTLVAHGMLAFTWISPYVSMILLGTMYSLLACALWPMVALVVPEHQLGTAYGFCIVISMSATVTSLVTSLVTSTVTVTGIVHVRHRHLHNYLIIVTSLLSTMRCKLFRILAWPLSPW